METYFLLRITDTVWWDGKQLMNKTDSQKDSI